MLVTAGGKTVILWNVTNGNIIRYIYDGANSF
jgi:hypothetical protein